MRRAGRLVIGVGAAVLAGGCGEDFPTEGEIDHEGPTIHALVTPIASPADFSGFETLITFDGLGLSPGDDVAGVGGVSFGLSDGTLPKFELDGTIREFGPPGDGSIDNLGRPAPLPDLIMTFPQPINTLGFALRTLPEDDIELTFISASTVVDFIMIPTKGPDRFFFYGVETDGLFDEVILRVQKNSPDLAGAFRLDNLRFEAKVDVDIDIKPGSDPNSINVDKPNGTVPVAILTTPEFDVNGVDPLSVRFGPGEAQEIHGQGHIEDVDSDQDLDLLLHFKVGDTGIRPGDLEACLKGFVPDGPTIKGCDLVQTRPIISGGGLVATPIATFEGGIASSQIARLERRPDGGLLSARRVGERPNLALELVAIELDGAFAVLDRVPMVGIGGLCCADYDFGPDGALYGSLANDFTLFRRDPDGGVTYEFSARLNVPPLFPGQGEFRNPLGMGFLPSGRIVVGSFGDQTFGDGPATFGVGDWREFAGPGTAFAADIVAIDEDRIWVYAGFILGDRRILEVARGGDVNEIASIPVATTDGGIFGDMIRTLPGAAVGAPGNLLLAAGHSLWEINPKNGKVFERLGGFDALNGVAYGGDGKLYVLNVAPDRTTTVFRVEPGKGKAVAE